MKKSDSKNVVFVTGAFVSSNCWDDWQTYFQSKGYNTIAPAWPFKEGTAAELRAKHPDGNKGLAELTLAHLEDHFIDIIKKIPDKPIVIGHSLGGLMTQVIVNRDFASAGVAIHSVPPLGVFPYEFSFLKGGWKSLGILTDTEETYLMSLKDWQYAFVNEMPLEEQQATYDKYTIPESKTVARGGLGVAAKIDFKLEHAPLLLTSGSIDNIIPAHLNHRNYEKYEKNNSILDYKEFEGRNHFVLGQPTWKEDADYILSWLEGN